MTKSPMTKEELLHNGMELPRMLLPLITEKEFEDILGKTTFLQRIREEEKEKGLSQGEQRGLEKGLWQGEQLLQNIRDALETVTSLESICAIYHTDGNVSAPTKTP
jgi:hypothetical protein